MNCINKSEKKLLSQHLNNPEVLLLIKHKKEKGAISTSTLVIIYLIEKDKISEKDEIEIIPVNIPLKEKMLKFS
jgi:hypothetical protein